MCEEHYGVNAFWYAAFFGRGKCIRLLAEAGIDILSKHKETGASALHVAVERKHHRVVDMLVDSGYPLDLKRQGGLTALIIGSRFKDDVGVRMCRKIVEGGADVNLISDRGDSALSEAIVHDNRQLADILIKVQANLMYDAEEMSE